VVTVSNLDTVCGPGGVVTVDTADTVPYGGPHVKRPRTACDGRGLADPEEVDMPDARATPVRGPARRAARVAAAVLLVACAVPFTVVVLRGAAAMAWGM